VAFAGKHDTLAGGHLLASCKEGISSDATTAGNDLPVTEQTPPRRYRVQPESQRGQFEGRDLGV